MMKKCMVTVLSTLISVLVFTGVVFSAPLIGDPSPQFELETLDGKKITLDELKCKKSLFIVFWATWCNSCHEKVPEINRLYKKFSSKGMTFLGVDVGINDSEAKVKQFVSKNNLLYPVVFDKNQALSKKFGVFGTPTVIIIDKEGIIRYKNYCLPENLEQHFSDLMCCC